MNFGGYENPNKRAETGFENVQNQKSISYELSFHRYDISAISLVGSIAVCPVFSILVQKFVNQLETSVVLDDFDRPTGHCVNVRVFVGHSPPKDVSTSSTAASG